MRHAVLALPFLFLTTARAHAEATVPWTPDAWGAEQTLELTTNAADEGTYTFPVWLVVLDGQLYVRLGSRAASRVEKNRDAPYVGVSVAGHRFDHVRAVPAPEDASRVARAMGAKYWSDLLIRWLPHPMTLRLVPE